MVNKNEKWIELLEGFGVAMRIFSFGMLSLMGKDTPFLTMWDYQYNRCRIIDMVCNPKKESTLYTT